MVRRISTVIHTTHNTRGGLTHAITICKICKPVNHKRVCVWAAHCGRFPPRAIAHFYSFTILCGTWFEIMERCSQKQPSKHTERLNNHPNKVHSIYEMVYGAAHNLGCYIQINHRSDWCASLLSYLCVFSSLYFFFETSSVSLCVNAITQYFSTPC